MGWRFIGMGVRFFTGAVKKAGQSAGRVIPTERDSLVESGLSDCDQGKYWDRIVA